MADIPLKKFVFISSLAALGPIPYQEVAPIQEQSKAQPVTAYGKSKLLAEQYLAELKDLPLVVLRPTAVYGPREKDIFIVLKTLNLGLEPYISNKPQWLSFVYVKDLAKAVMQALGTSISGVTTTCPTATATTVTPWPPPPSRSWARRRSRCICRWGWLH
ncbi:hypothetical protein GCM10028895_54370 [Pontibacter rugosus]